MPDPPRHELEYRRHEAGPPDEVEESPLRNASFLAIASLPVWLSAGLFTANLLKAGFLPYVLQFTTIEAGPASFPNVQAALMFIVVLVFGGMLGFSVLVMSVKALADNRRAGGVELLMTWFALLASPAAVVALVAMLMNA